MAETPDDDIPFSDDERDAYEAQMGAVQAHALSIEEDLQRSQAARRAAQKALNHLLDRIKDRRNAARVPTTALGNWTYAAAPPAAKPEGGG